MSQLQIEFLKIILDKGILALALVCVGYFVSKAIEKYKSRNIYFQKVSEAKIQAYRDIAKVLSNDYIQNIDVNLLADFNSKLNNETSNKQEIIAKLTTALSKRRDIVNEGAVILSMNSIFFSRDVRNAITNYLQASNELNMLANQFLSNINANDNKKSVQMLVESSGTLGQAFSDLLMKLEDDVNVSPFG